MIKITDSTVFNSGAECIVNTINCVGFMGKGIALEFALRYPELEKQYIAQCRNRLIHTGELYFYNINGQKIINFPTKFDFKHPSQIEWIEEGLQYFLNNYKNWDIKSIAFPLLGASNGGLDPKVVEELMKKYLSQVDIEVFICHSKLVEGKELEIVKAFKKIDPKSLKQYMRLTTKQINSLESHQDKIVRFTDILKIEGIGVDTYKSIFKLIYNKNIELFEAISLI